MTDTAVQTSEQADVQPYSVPKPLDIKKILNLRDCHGLSFADIGRQLNCTRHAANYAYKQFTKQFPDYEQTKLYEANKISYLNQAEYLLLQDIVSEDKREKASLNNSGYVWDKVFGRNREEQGKGTGSGTTITIQMVYQEAEAHTKQIRQAHGQVQVSVNTNQDETQ
jgi:hypothetical protein